MSPARTLAHRVHSCALVCITQVMKAKSASMRAGVAHVSWSRSLSRCRTSPRGSQLRHLPQTYIGRRRADERELIHILRHGSSHCSLHTPPARAASACTTAPCPACPVRRAASVPRPSCRSPHRRYPSAYGTSPPRAPCAPPAAGYGEPRPARLGIPTNARGQANLDLRRARHDRREQKP